MSLILFKYILVTTIVMTKMKTIIFGLSPCLSGPCVHGVCVDTEKDTYRCYCINGYTGLNCQTNYDDCRSMPCQHGATCIDGVASFTCVCLEGYTGSLCEENVNECLSDPCLNDGVCRDSVNGYTCECLPGFKGEHCEEDINVCEFEIANNSYCLNGGICIDGPGYEYTCNCPPGFEGVYCEKEFNECGSFPCLNGGVCIDKPNNFSCICLFGWTGKFCETEVKECKENFCENEGICLVEISAAGINITEPTCYCVPDFHGIACEQRYNECLPASPCMNGGTCIDGVDSFSCMCPFGFIGALCENSCKTIICDIDTTSEIITQLYTSPLSYDFSKMISTTLEETSEVSFLDIYSSVSFEVSRLITAMSDTLTTLISSPSISPKKTISIITSSEQIDWIPSQTTIDSTISIPSFEESYTTLPFYSSVIPISTEKHVFDSTESSITMSTKMVDLSSSVGDLIYSSYFMSSSEVITEESSYFRTEDIEISTTQVSKTFMQSMETEVSIFTMTSHPSYPLFASTEFLSSSSERLASSSSLYITLTSDEFEISQSADNVSLFSPITLNTSSTDFIVSEFQTSLLQLSTQIEDSYIIGNTSEIYPFSSHLISEMVPTQSSITDFLEVTSPFPIANESTCESFICENGGTLIENFEQNFKFCECICPLHVTGANCEKEILVHNPQFSNHSFLKHILPEINTQQRLNINFTFKTISSDGLLFYAESFEDKSFLLLQIQNGSLKLKFSCGQQTMVFRESNIKVNSGYFSSISLSLEIMESKESSSCIAKLQVNNTSDMSGQQQSLHPKIQFRHIYFGGVPFNNTLSQKNVDKVIFFSGCMKDLKISNKNKKMVKDAEDGANIIECDDGMCATIICQNGGTCSSNGEAWRCLCRKGYSGIFCEHLNCDANPCEYGGTCLPINKNTEYICLCPYGYHGLNCDQLLNITRSSFHGSIMGYSSFLQYLNTMDVQYYLDVELKFTLTKLYQKGLIAFMGQRDTNDPMTDYLAIGLENGFVEYYLDLGSGYRKLQSVSSLNMSMPIHTISFGHHRRYLWLVVDTQKKVTGLSPGKLNALNVLPYLFIGGHSSYNFSLLPFPVNNWNGYNGCIFDVKIKVSPENSYFNLNDVIAGRNIQQCNKSECDLIKCENGGTCINLGTTFMCLCNVGWTGTRCTNQITPCNSGSHHCAPKSICTVTIDGYRCDCILGQAGKYCNETINIIDPQFNGMNSFMEFKSQNIRRKTIITMQFKPMSDNGILFYASQQMNENSGDFAAIVIKNGHVEFRFNLGTGTETTTVLQNSHKLSLDTWHTVTVDRYERSANLIVDDIEVVNQSPAGMRALDVNTNFFIGGIPEFLLTTTNIIDNSSFYGCISWFEVNSKIYNLTPKGALNGLNINNCRGKICGHHICRNKGICIDHLDGKFSCKCLSNYSGPLCETHILCLKHKCQNGGTCIPNLSNGNYSCDCSLGWTGSKCEIAIEITIPRFKYTSYLYFWDENYDRRDLKRTYLAFDFLTLNQSGLLFWSGKFSRNDDYIGIGLENGYIIVVWNLGWLSHKKITTEDTYSDNKWHSIVIDRLKQELILKIDNKQYNSKVIGNYYELNTNGHYYFGGFPRSVKIDDETRNHFSMPFNGCISNIILPYYVNYSNITEANGSRNINNCDTAKFV
ncbi:protein eyes shut-like [Centruroides sculpturatus]|uniref:protein eyes shut-like n=1 Tax=Centruroides sculpturatus TaxID=218467 RepID=UPI000C6D75AF|nr:protein eyes shut-like [Centruroides sculpturatus]